VRFERLLAVVPQCREDGDGGLFEDEIYKLADQRNMELYVNLPHQIEAFPISFEDPFSIYRLEPNQQTGRYKVRKFHQDKSEEEFRVHCNIIHQAMQEQGLFLPEFNTLVTVSTLRGVEYDEMRDSVNKVYSDECLTVPVNVCMRRRSAAHPLNVNERCNAAHGRITAKAPALCFN
jgi:hypothetical protein